VPPSSRAGILDVLRQDLRFASRTIGKTPVFALAAVLTLALGIGGTTAIFSVLRAVVLKPLAYRDPGRLVRVAADYPRRNLQDTTFTKREFDKVAGPIQSFAGMGAYLNSAENMILSGTGQPEALKGARISANFLSILGVEPETGRGFLAEEDVRGGRLVAVISDRLWKRTFHGDPEIGGKRITLNSAPYTVVGVLPPDFAFPFAEVDVWVPRPAEFSAFPQRYWDNATTLIGFARLKPGVSVEHARAEMDVFNRRELAADSGKYVPSMRISGLKEQLVANVRPTLWSLFAAVGFVLLIACANVASLLLARAASRSREFAVRAAMGAARVRLIAQLLIESLVLAAAGAIGGVLLARWAIGGFTHSSAMNVPRLEEIRLDSVVLAFAAVLSIATGVLFGLLPALRASRPDLVNELRESGMDARRGWPARTRGLLLAGQIAFSIVLLIGAALLMKSFVRLQSVNPGFDAANLLTAKISLPAVRYDTDLKRASFFDGLVERLNHTLQVRGATMAMTLPTTPWLRTNIQIEGMPWDPDPGNWPSIQIQSVTPDYFRTLGIPLRRGREFTDRDNSPSAPPAVMINESFARRFWPMFPAGPSPTGEHLREGADKTGWLEIVGVVGDVHEGGLAVNPLPEFYVLPVIHAPQTAYIAVRSDGNAMRLVNVLRQAVLATDRDQPISDVKSMEDVLGATLGQRRLTMWLVGGFAAIALVLALVGIYGVIAYSVAQRTQEVGIRRALGAQHTDILRMVLMEAFGFAFAGVLLGVAGTLALSRAIKNMLFEVSATDPAAIAAVALLFLAVALVASYLPAKRAAHIDPMTALRIG
jgi:putative ABC transport system permease protein